MLELVERPVPEPADGQVRVRVEAAGVHPVDVFVRSGPPAGFLDALVDAAVIGPPAISAVRDGGRFVAVTAYAPAPERGVSVATIDVQPDGHRLAELSAAVDAGTLTPRLVATYPFAEVAEAHRRQAKGGIRGRLVLVPQPLGPTPVKRACGGGYSAAGSSAVGCSASAFSAGTGIRLAWIVLWITLNTTKPMTSHHW